LSLPRTTADALSFTKVTATKSLETVLDIAQFKKGEEVLVFELFFQMSRNDFQGQILLSFLFLPSFTSFLLNCSLDFQCAMLSSRTIKKRLFNLEAEWDLDASQTKTEQLVQNKSPIATTTSSSTEAAQAQAQAQAQANGDDGRHHHHDYHQEEEGGCRESLV
jgi:hypothetical protein